MKEIIFENEHRRKHFEFFRSMNHPHFAITANVDITQLHVALKSQSLPFMPSVAWLVSKVANEIPPFRWRIRDEQVVEHEIVHPSFAVGTDGADVFSFCEVKFKPAYRTFLVHAEKKIEQMRTAPSFEDEHGRDDYLFLSSIPWVSFTALQHAMHFHPHDSVPRITWGKFFKDGDTIKMPLNAQAHHGLVDGRHMGELFERFEKLCAEPSLLS